MLVTNNATSPAATSVDNSQSKVSQNTLDYTAFLRLLVEQLKHQDPTEPMKASEQLAQLAAFSSVEQTVQTNKKLDDIISLLSVSQAGNLVGKNIVSADGKQTGQVESVKVGTDGATAVLKNGAEVTLTRGYQVISHE